VKDKVPFRFLLVGKYNTFIHKQHQFLRLMSAFLII